MEYDGWTRKLVSVLREWGFEPTGNKATSHKKWRYEGPKTERAVSIVVPAQVKGSSRAVTVASIRKNLRNAGASKEAIAEFNKFALGLIEAEATDPLDELEDKLAAAITNKATLAAAKLAFQLAKTASDKNYESRAIKQRSGELDEEQRKRELSSEIEELLLKRIKGMFNRQIDDVGPIAIGGQRGRYRQQPKIDDSLTAEFGFEIDDFDMLAYNNYKIKGHMSGDTAQHFVPHIIRPMYEVTLDSDLSEDEYYECYSGSDLFGMQIYGLDGLRISELETILASVKSHQVMLELAGRLDDTE